MQSPENLGDALEQIQNRLHGFLTSMNAQEISETPAPLRSLWETTGTIVERTLNDENLSDLVLLGELPPLLSTVFRLLSPYLKTPKEDQHWSLLVRDALE